jgi:hypothetical protein
MSYSVIAPCYYCEKKNSCKDLEKVQSAVNSIHNSNDGSHLGSGSVIISCVKMVSNSK